MDKELKMIQGVITGSMLVVIFIAVVTIASEVSPLFKDWLKITFGHHWVGKSILASIVFVLGSTISTLIARETTIEEIGKRINLLTYLVVLCSVAIGGFFIFEASI